MNTANSKKPYFTLIFRTPRLKLVPAALQTEIGDGDLLRYELIWVLSRDCALLIRK